MSDIVFANQKPSDEQIEAFVQQWLTPIRSPAWALIDMALLRSEGRDSLKRQRQWRPIINAFEATSLAAFGDLAPHLLALPDEAEALRDTLRRLFGLTGDATAISWIHSAHSPTSVQQTLAYLAKVQIDLRKMPVHCRFADTRVLPELLRILSPSQQQRIAAVIQTWGWPARDGSPKSWHGSIDSTNTQDERPILQLTADQFRRMQHAAEPDGIFLMLHQQTPELVPPSNRSGFHSRLVRMLGAAETLGIKNIKDKLQFVVLSLTCGEEFHTLHELQPTWMAVSEGAHLHMLIQTWSDSLWGTLDRHNRKTG